MDSNGKLDYNEFKTKMVSGLLSKGCKGWKLKSGTRRHAGLGETIMDFSNLKDVDRIAAAVTQDYMEQRPQLFLNLIRDVLKLEEKKRVAVRVDFGLGFETICLLEGGLCPKYIKKMPSISVQLVIAPDSSEKAADGIISRRDKYMRVPYDDPCTYYKLLCLLPNARFFGSPPFFRLHTVCKYLVNLDYEKTCIYIHDCPKKEKYQGTEWLGDSSGKKRILRLFSTKDFPHRLATGRRVPEFERCVINGTRPVRQKPIVESVGKEGRPDLDYEKDNPIFEADWFQEAGCADDELEEDSLSSSCESTEEEEDEEVSTHPSSLSKPNGLAGHVCVDEDKNAEKITASSPEPKEEIASASERPTQKYQTKVNGDVQVTGENHQSRGTSTNSTDGCEAMAATKQSPKQTTARGTRSDDSNGNIEASNPISPSMGEAKGSKANVTTNGSAKTSDPRKTLGNTKGPDLITTHGSAKTSDPRKILGNRKGPDLKSAPNVTFKDSATAQGRAKDGKQHGPKPATSRDSSTPTRGLQDDENRHRSKPAPGATSKESSATAHDHFIYGKRDGRKTALTSNASTTSPASRDSSRNNKEFPPKTSPGTIPGVSVAQASLSKPEGSVANSAPTPATVIQGPSTHRPGESASKAAKRDRASRSDNASDFEPQSKKQKRAEDGNNVTHDHRHTDDGDGRQNESTNIEKQSRKNSSGERAQEDTATLPPSQQEATLPSEYDAAKSKREKKARKEAKKAKKEAKKKAKKAKKEKRRSE